MSVQLQLRVSMSGPHDLTQDHIDVLEEHLPYELDALEEALAAWGLSSAAGPANRQEWIARIAPIEAFWVHARLLHEFFTKDQVRAASAVHFTKTGEFAKLPDVEQIQTQIVHLNYGRPRGLDPAKLDFWFARRFAEAVDRAVQVFQANLTDAARKYWVMRDRMLITSAIEPEVKNAIWATSTTRHGDRLHKGAENEMPTYSGLAPTGPAPPKLTRS